MPSQSAGNTALFALFVLAGGCTGAGTISHEGLASTIELTADNFSLPNYRPTPNCLATAPSITYRREL